MSVQFLSREIRLPTSAQELESRFEFDHWMMTDAERSTLTTLLQKLRPDCAIEIGTYRAGSLSVIADCAKKVYSLDIDPSCKANYAEQFPNVEFVVGNSRKTLPAILQEIEKSGVPLQFVLIDGDHSEEGLRNDINDLLRYRPTAPLYIVMHDSFNPDCRRGIRGANWVANPHVHLVELDYVSGRLMPKDEDGSYRQMWCGFALAVLLPESRTGDLVIHENEPNGYLAAYWASTHPYTRIQAQVRRASGFLKRLPRKLSAR